MQVKALRHKKVKTLKKKSKIIKSAKSKETFKLAFWLKSRKKLKYHTLIHTCKSCEDRRKFGI